LAFLICLIVRGGQFHGGVLRKIGGSERSRGWRVEDGKWRIEKGWRIEEDGGRVEVGEKRG
jgi:hypothetical protein